MHAVLAALSDYMLSAIKTCLIMKNSDFEVISTAVDTGCHTISIMMTANS